ncbi:hypothetical protein NQZ68_000638 [Dissostichus eleginoides]|nr:hypothetical protein NQZ68_000638 [Dissostichus eleginoides]
MQYIVISNPWQHKEENTSNVDSNTYSVGSWDEDNMSVEASQSTVQSSSEVTVVAGALVALQPYQVQQITKRKLPLIDVAAELCWQIVKCFRPIQAKQRL